MSERPLPSRISELLKLDLSGNRSLLFDKGMDEYDALWQIGAKAKETFLQKFTSLFHLGDDGTYPTLVKRRAATFERLGASCREFVTQTRLVIGLGLPSPLETGFLFDRCMGCPYLPGSSVKGLLRAAAKLVREGELGGDKDFWLVNFERVFGPEITPGAITSTGKAVFFDAFPAAWPKLEIDVLTPHYGSYYREGDAPGDWDDPVPVSFLAVAPGTAFRFYIQAHPADFAQLAPLLETSLDWLGIGAKKSAGYGMFGKEAPALPQSAAPPKPSAPPPPPPPSPAKAPLFWENAELSLRQATVTARRGKLAATCRKTDVESSVLDALSKKSPLRADVEVLKVGNGDYRLVRVKQLRI